MANIKRRDFLRKSVLATSGIILATNFISCKEEGLPLGLENIPTDLIISNFNEGVASFDPTNSQVIIWSRYTTKNPSVTIIWQLAEDEKFEKIVRQGEVITGASRDYTVAIEIKELDENKKFFYRFINVADKAVSSIGETLTFGSNVSEVKMAVTSCANYAYGYFNVYEAMKNSGADVIIHLGDYIYEYGENTYGKFRAPEPKGEIISLDDYRTRYRQYRSDKKLMELHQKKPFICVWDDHEITNDSYKDGAENHQLTEGSYELRKQYALQAYSEYLPNTTNIENDKIIYRNLKIGNLVDLIMLDTRIIGRDKQLSYGDYITSTGFDQNAFGQAWLNPTRTILGEEQRNWFLQQMASSKAPWQIIGQQVLMAKMMLPAELLLVMARITAEAEKLGSATPEALGAFQKSVVELLTIKARIEAQDPTLTSQEKGRLTTVLPYNLDAWDGYPVEREMVISSFKGKKVAVLAGDTHNAWQSDLVLNDGAKVGSELATPSVSSPGLETYLGGNPNEMKYALEQLVSDLNYVNTYQRGFMSVTITSASVETKWNFVDTVTSETYSIIEEHTHTI